MNQNNIATLMAQSHACRQSDDAAGEREAIDNVLTVDPYFVPAHLARADWIERFGDLWGAVTTLPLRRRVHDAVPNLGQHFRPREIRFSGRSRKHRAFFGNANRYSASRYQELNLVTGSEPLETRRR